MEDNKITEESLEAPAGPDTKPPKANAEPANPSPSIPNPASPPESFKPNWRQRLGDQSNRYLVVFLLLVAAGAAAIFFSWQFKKNNTNGQKSGSLTAEQLSQLSSSGTVIGDPKQTLDIQSNTVLEGQLLIRKDADIAGSLKVGGGLSLASITVGGQGSFGQLQVNGTLSVLGNTALAGLLSVQKNLNVAGAGSFGGNLSANQLSVSTLQLAGDLQVNRHITLGGSVPGKASGAALGSGGTASINGSDTAGTITINTGSSAAAGNLVTINFTAKFNSTPHVVVTPVGSAAAGLQYYLSRTTTGFTLSTLNAPASGSSFSFDYIVID